MTDLSYGHEYFCIPLRGGPHDLLHMLRSAWCAPWAGRSLTFTQTQGKFHTMTQEIYVRRADMPEPGYMNYDFCFVPGPDDEVNEVMV